MAGRPRAEDRGSHQGRRAGRRRGAAASGPGAVTPAALGAAGIGALSGRRQGEALRTIRQVRRELDTQARGIHPSPRDRRARARPPQTRTTPCCPSRRSQHRAERVRTQVWCRIRSRGSDSFFGREADTQNCAGRDWQSGRSSRSSVRRAAGSRLWSGLVSQQLCGGRVKGQS